MTRARTTRLVATAVVCTTVCGWMPRPALAQGSAPVDVESLANPQELAKKLVNPLTDLVSVPLQFNWLNNVGPEKELRSLIYFQPVVPMSVNEKWNVIGRLVVPYLSQPAAFGGSSGLSDVMAQAFFSPKTSGTFTWGAGPMFNLPVPTDPTLGLGKWAAGPAVAVMKQKGGMTYGMLVNHIWSFASTGDIERSDVSMSYVQPVIAHTSRSGVTVSATMEAVADWEAVNPDDTWSIPINVLVSKLTRFANTPMSVQIGGGYYIAQQSYGPHWQLRTTFTLLLPRRQ